GAVLRQPLDAAVEVDGGIGHLPAGDAGVGEQRADAAFDVDEGVTFRGAGGVGDLVVVLGPLHEVGAELLEDHAALGEGELRQSGQAGAAGMVGDGGEVDAFGAHLVEQLARARVVDGTTAGGGIGRVPDACRIRTEGFGHAVVSLVKRRLPVHGGRVRRRCRFLAIY